MNEELIPRTVNLPDRVWDAACAAAADDGIDTVVLFLLAQYVSDAEEDTRGRVRASSGPGVGRGGAGRPPVTRTMER